MAYIYPEPSIVEEGILRRCLFNRKLFLLVSSNVSRVAALCFSVSAENRRWGREEGQSFHISRDESLCGGLRAARVV